MSSVGEKKVCRTCFSLDTLRPLFPHPDQLTSFERALYLSTGLKIKVDDGLPQNICRKCSKIIETAMKFRLQSQVTEKKLLQYFKFRTQIPETVKSADTIKTENNAQYDIEMLQKCEVKVEYEKGRDVESVNDNDESNVHSSSSISEQDFFSSGDELLYHKPPFSKPEELSDNSRVCSNNTYNRKRYLELVEGPLDLKKPIQCKVCKKVSKSFNTFEKHAMSHLGYNILCEFCAKSCISTTSLLRHQRAKHGLARDNSFPCSFCGFQAIDKEQLQVHERKIHTKERPFVCGDCGAGFFSKRVLIQHRVNHKADKPFQIELDDGLPQNICWECSKAVETAMRFRLQSRATEKKLLQYCKYRSHKSDNVTDNDETEEKPICSDDNDLEPYVKDEIYIHKSCTEAESGNDNDDCNVNSLSPVQTSDDEVLSLKQSRQCSDETSLNRKKYIFKRENYDKKRYLGLIEGPVVPKQPIKCRLCKKFSKCMNSFEKHAMSHLGYNILCEFCAKACISTANLLRHQRRKHGLARDNSFPCTACGFQAIDKEQLEVHERRVHTKERPFVCDDCGAAFFSKRVLIQHQANHRTDKPFQCELCSLKFKLRCRLTKHMHRVHTKNYCKYTYECYICQKRYSRTQHVRKHLVKIHNVPLKQQEKVQRYEIQSVFHASFTVSPNSSPPRQHPHCNSHYSIS